MGFRFEAHRLSAKFGFYCVEDTVLVWGVFVEDVNDALARGNKEHAGFRFIDSGVRTGGDRKRLDHFAVFRIQHYEHLGVAPRTEQTAMSGVDGKRCRGAGRREWPL